MISVKLYEKRKMNIRFDKLYWAQEMTKKLLAKEKNVTKSWGNSRGCDILHPP